MTGIIHLENSQTANTEFKFLLRQARISVLLLHALQSEYEAIGKGMYWKAKNKKSYFVGNTAES